MIHPVFVDHLVFRVAELDRTERFYTAVLGHAPQKSLDSLMYTVGDTLLFFTLASDETPYDKEQIGLNHIAFGLRTIEELKELQVQLHGSGIAHSGIDTLIGQAPCDDEIARTEISEYIVQIGRDEDRG